jgi:hypothetical protein
VNIRAAIWFVFKQKIPISEKFSGLQIGKCRYILLPFGIFYGHLGIFYGHLARFVFIWYLFPVLVSCSKTNLATLVNIAKIV